MNCITLKTIIAAALLAICGMASAENLTVLIGKGEEANKILTMARNFKDKEKLGGVVLVSPVFTEVNEQMAKQLPDVPYYFFQSLTDSPVVLKQSEPLINALRQSKKKVVRDLASGKQPKFQKRRCGRVIAALEKGMKEPVALVFSFDDATADHMVAAKALEKYGWHGTFNIITDRLDREAANPRGRYLTWENAKALVEAGHQVNSHSVHHIDFGKATKEGRIDDIRAEVFGSRDAIEKHTGKRPEFFCYPFVKGTNKSDEIIVEAGMRPMNDLRIGFGGPEKKAPAALDNRFDGPNSVAKLAEKWYETEYVVRDMMFHGIVPGIGEWRTFVEADGFEKNLPALKELEKAGKVIVVDYDEFYDFAMSRNMARRF